LIPSRLASWIKVSGSVTLAARRTGRDLEGVGSRDWAWDMAGIIRMIYAHGNGSILRTNTDYDLLFAAGPAWISGIRPIAVAPR
jgi:hypothetical protein